MYDRTKDKNIKSKTATIKNKTWTKEKIVKLLNTNDKAVERAILRLYSFQTIDERTYGHTETNNGVGFNRYDANLLSGFAEQLIQYKRPLSGKQLIIARKKLVKYANQLLNYVESKGK